MGSKVKGSEFSHILVTKDATWWASSSSGAASSITRITVPAHTLGGIKSCGLCVEPQAGKGSEVGLGYRASYGCYAVSDSCNPMDCSLPESSVHEIFQARILNGLPFPSPGDLPDPVLEPRFPAFQADSLPLSHQGSPQAAYHRGQII